MISIFIGFILGVLFTIFIMPVMESLTAVVLTMLEVVKGYFASKVAKYNKVMQETLQGEEESMHRIGFIIPEEEGEDIEYND